MAVVFLDGKFLDAGDARLGVFDAGLQHGVGLFETMVGGVGEPPPGHEETGGGVSGDGAWIFRLGAHVDRLIGSARELGLTESLRGPALAEALLATLARAGERGGDVRRWRVRLTMTGGDLNLLRGEGGRVTPTVLIVAQPATEYPAEMFDRGVSAAIADARANPLNPAEGHKTLNYWWRLRALRDAAAKLAGEALVFQVTNHLAGGCVSNAFVVKSGELLTPIARGEEGTRPGEPSETADPSNSGDGRDRGVGVYLPSPVLPGVVRAWVMEWAEANGVAVRRRAVSIGDVLGADEVFLTNSGWGVLPVVRVEREAIGDGSVGPMTRALIERWREER